MKTIAKWLALPLMAIFLSTSSAAFAGEPFEKGNKKYGEREHKRNFGFRELGLTDEQREQLDNQRQEQIGKSEKIFETLKAKKKALHEEIAKSEADTAKINGLVDEINSLKGQLFSQRIEGLLATKKVLTQEQFEKMEKMKKGFDKPKRKKGFWGFRGKGEKEGRDCPFRQGKQHREEMD